MIFIIYCIISRGWHVIEMAITIHNLPTTHYLTLWHLHLPDVFHLYLPSAFSHALFSPLHLSAIIPRIRYLFISCFFCLFLSACVAAHIQWNNGHVSYGCLLKFNFVCHFSLQPTLWKLQKEKRKRHLDSINASSVLFKPPAGVYHCDSSRNTSSTQKKSN